MARLVRDIRIDSRSARIRLAIRDAPYWTKIAKGCFVGYRKGHLGGTWSARYRDIAGKQQYLLLGPADDALDADGSLVSSFDQAQERARAWFHLVASNGASRPLH